MAYINASARPAAFELFLGLAAHMRESAAKRRSFNQIVRELSALSDRELEDVGISRFNIGQIAREHAYGA